MLECTQICDEEVFLHFAIPICFGVSTVQVHYSLQSTFPKIMGLTEHGIWKTGTLHKLCYILPP